MADNDITRPLRLAIGSHKKGEGLACAMNIISWQNGDTEITDMPDCSDPMLSRVMQRMNDSFCTHLEGRLLCAECSVIVLKQAHRTVGTAGIATHSHYVQIAVRLARQVQHLNTDPRVEAALMAAENCIKNPTLANINVAKTAANAADAAAAAAVNAANTDAAYAAAYAAAANAAEAAADAAAYAADAAAYAADAAAVNAANTDAAAYAAAAAVNAAEAAAAYANTDAEKIIDLWFEITGHEEGTAPQMQQAVIAYEQMIDAKVNCEPCLRV